MNWKRSFLAHIVTAILLVAVMAMSSACAATPTPTPMPTPTPTSAPDPYTPSMNWQALSAGNDYVIGRQSDGTVIATGFYDEINAGVADWRDIVSVSAGRAHAVGLTKFGNVVAVGSYAVSDIDQASANMLKTTESWTGMVAVSAGYDNSYGLKSDGTVVAAGSNEYGQCDVEKWRDIAMISAGSLYVVGLKKDGTVIGEGTSDGLSQVFSWTDIVSISAGNSVTIGLKKDGTVVDTAGFTTSWTGIVAVSAGAQHVVGLKADGTVVAAGANDSGQCNVSSWTDIVAVEGGWNTTVGLKRDGTVVIAGVSYNALPWTGIAPYTEELAFATPTPLPTVDTSTSITAIISKALRMKRNDAITFLGDNYAYETEYDVYLYNDLGLAVYCVEDRVFVISLSADKGDVYGMKSGSTFDQVIAKFGAADVQTQDHQGQYLDYYLEYTIDAMDVRFFSDGSAAQTIQSVEFRLP